MAAPGANPRKFAEKIAQHVQKGAEEEAEFRKIMAELAAVKQGDRVSDMPCVSLDNLNFIFAFVVYINITI